MGPSRGLRPTGPQSTRSAMASGSTTLLLVRHGHTAGNGTGPDVPMSGWFDVPLSAKGMQEAQAVSGWLARGGRIAAIYTSPLQRARRTAVAIGAACGLPVRPVPALREIHCGEADGLPLAEVQRKYRGAWARNSEQTDPDFCWPGGETYRAFRTRVLGSVHELGTAHADERIVLVTHAGAINQLLGSIAGVSPARWEPFRQRNGSVTEVVYQEGVLRLISFDARPSLEVPAELRLP